MATVGATEKYTGTLREVIRYINQYGIQNWSIEELYGGLGGWLGITGPVKIFGAEFVNLPMSVYITKTDDSMYWLSEQSLPRGWKGYDWLDFVAKLSASPYVKEVGIVDEWVFQYNPPLGCVATSSPGELLSIAYQAPSIPGVGPTPSPSPGPTPIPQPEPIVPSNWTKYLLLGGLGLVGFVLLLALIRELRT
jgi:hypothetical protein